MCGIAVKYIRPKEVSSILKKIQHRGNNFKTIVYKDYGFGHTRLAIQGLNSKYDQPIITDEEIILYNGEIFNYKELNYELESDVMLLLGNPDYRLFDGYFAVVKYKKNTDSLEVVTDRFGQKQLYYRIENGIIVGIASEIKALVKENDKLNLFYMSRVSRFGYFFGSNQTIVKNIYRFNPGKRYCIAGGKILEEYQIEWDSRLLIPNDVNKNNLYDLIDLSVKRRLTSDVPVSMLLSGGLDSTIILHHIMKYNRKIEIFTIENSDDLIYANKIAKEFGIKLNKLRIDSSKDTYKKAHFTCELGCDLGSVIPNYLLFKIIKNKGFKVVISGDGADEIFLGYKRNALLDMRESDFNDELMSYHLPRLDKLSMAHTIELRNPFMAQYIVDYAFKIPYNDMLFKKLLKKTYMNLLPKYIIERKKEPLKINNIKENKIESREELIKFWINNFNLFAKK